MIFMKPIQKSNKSKSETNGKRAIDEPIKNVIEIRDVFKIIDSLNFPHSRYNDIIKEQAKGQIQMKSFIIERISKDDLKLVGGLSFEKGTLKENTDKVFNFMLKNKISRIAESVVVGKVIYTTSKTKLNKKTTNFLKRNKIHSVDVAICPRVME